MLLRAQGYKFRFLELSIYRLHSYTIGYLTPTAQLGGEPLRIYHLRERNVPLKHAVASVVIDRIMEHATTTVFIISGFLVLLAKGLLQGDDIFFVGIVLAMISVLLLYFYLTTVYNKGPLSSIIQLLRLHRFEAINNSISRIEEVEETLHFYFTKHRLTMVYCVAVSIVYFLLIIFEYWMLMYFFGVTITFTQALILATLPMLGYMLPIPGGLGALEGLQLTTFAATHLPEALALPLIMTVRLKDLVFLFAGMISISAHGWGILKSVRAEKAIETEIKRDEVEMI